MMVNDAGRNHFLKVLNEGVRYDKRKMDEYRDLKITRGCAKTAEGSAEVKLGETHVIAGVKFGLESPFPDTPDEGILMVNVEQSPVASPEFEVGPPSIEAIELARVVDRGLRESKLVDLKELCVKEGEKAWFISIDIVTVNDDGNLLDACGLAALAALQDAKFPKVVDGEVDYHEKTKKGLELKKIPIPVTVYKYEDHLLIDPTHDEEVVADARLTVTTLSSGEICALQKGGKSPITTEEVEKMVELSLKKGEELRKVLEKGK
jgi:exosome complex component RRP42